MQSAPGKPPSFYDKTNYLYTYRRRARASFGWEVKEVNRLHGDRNEIQHRGVWVVPSRARVDLLAEAARDTLELFRRPYVFSTGPLPTGRVTSVSWYLALGVSLSTDDAAAWAGTAKLDADDRRLAGTVYELVRKADPQRDGLFVGEIATLALESQATRGAEAEDELERILGSMTVLFERLSPGVFAWRDPESLDAEGLAGRRLADQAFMYLLVHDPANEGLHYAQDLLPGIASWGVRVRGSDPGATLRNAMRNDNRFESLGRGRYGLTPRPPTQRGDSPADDPQVSFE